MLFEWDNNKNLSNIEKHKVSFEEASEVWNDPNLVVLNAKKKGEKRFLAIGKSLSVLYSVIHTKRGKSVRIISARRSTQKEKRLYERYK